MSGWLTVSGLAASSFKFQVTFEWLKIAHMLPGSSINLCFSDLAFGRLLLAKEESYITAANIKKDCLLH